MPFKSNRQRAFLFANKPDVARRFAEEEKGRPRARRRRKRKKGALSGKARA